MHYHTGGLVDNDQIMIFVNNVDWNILGNNDSDGEGVSSISISSAGRTL